MRVILSLEKSLLVIQKILGLLVNPLTTDDRYSLLNRDNLLQKIQMQISKKQKQSFHFYCVFLKSRSNFENFDKQDDPQSLCISEISDCEKRAQINVSKTPFHKTLRQVT